MAASTVKDQAGRGFVYKSLSMKLIFHQKSSKAEEVLLNLRDCGFSVGDVLEIYHKRINSEGRAVYAYPRLLLQVPHTLGSEENATLRSFPGTNTISVEESVALQFRLQQFEQVRVTRINPEKVALQLLEITFKDQYLNRSDMWRLTKHLGGSVVYKNKMVEFCGQAIRCQVYEMWSQGSRVACGYVSSDTKVVYRSSTSRFYLFIQMSSEMWEFDHFGDLYFEKAVSGFLTDLFDKWKKMNTNHDVTIVMFSRSFYPTAKSLDEFPADMRACVQIDPLGRFYQDFYRVAVQNERHDDWSCVLRTLRQLFYHYPSAVLGRQTIHGETLPDVRDTHAQRTASRNPDDSALNGQKSKAAERSSSVIKPPRAELSTADQGNFLEVLNMSLNVFEKQYADRSMERTGQMSVVITPGVGVFQVERTLTNITKQRIIDNGVGSDLVCLGEQPLHAVPLLKFQKRRGGGDDYSMPHNWINLSFYSSNKKGRRAVMGDLYVPRIRVPEPCIPSFFPNAHARSAKRAFGEHRPTSARHHVSNLLEPLQPAPSISLQCPASIILDHARAAELLKLKWSLSHMSSTPRPPQKRKPLKKKPAPANGKENVPGKGTKNDQEQRNGFNATSASNITLASDMTTAELETLMNAYDEAIFKYPYKPYSSEYRGGRPLGLSSGGQSGVGRKKSSMSMSEHHSSSSSQQQQQQFVRQLSDPDLRRSDQTISLTEPDGGGRAVTCSGAATHTTSSVAASPPTAASYRGQYNKHYPQSFGALNLEVSDASAAAAAIAAFEDELEVSSYDPYRGGPGGAPLINPFDPKYTTIKLTSYRRRWVHIFPKNVSGALIQQHHKEDDALKKDLTTYPSSSEDDLEEETLADLTEEDSSTQEAPVCTNDNLDMGRSAAAAAAGVAEGGTGSTSSSRPPSMQGVHKHRASLVPLGPSSHDTLLWGATGEQEWSAAITTGVDWKSLTLPACLPITTDFFPSEESIQKDYVVSNYALLPTDVNEPNRGHQDKPEYGENVERKLLPPVFGRTRLTPAQTFSEIVSQRLAQGFQLILPKEETRSSARLKKHHKKKGFPVTLSQEWQGASSVRASAADIRSAVAYKAATAAPVSRAPAVGGSASQKQLPGCPSAESEERADDSITRVQHLHNPEYRLSIGTLFHRLTLVCNHRIDVSVYRPRIMSETLKKDYKYRFCAPYMTGYELSSTKFKTERLDRYQWNYFDNYVSFYSDNTQNSLAEHLKFWRIRLLLVPDLYRSILRQLIDKWREFPDAGIYPPLSQAQRIAVNDSFLKFFESLHRIKRQVVKKPKAASSAGQGGTPSLSGSVLTRSGGNGVRERSISAREGPVHHGGGGVVKDRVLSGGTSAGGSGDTNEGAKLTIPLAQAAYSTSSNDSRPREHLPSDGTIQHDSSTISSIAHSTVSSSSSQSLQVLPTVSEDHRCLSSDSELSDIVAAMTAGMNFFSPPHPDLPPLSFLSTDVVPWFREHVRNVSSREEAMKLLQRLVSEDYVRHASGLKRVTVYYGFYIYFIVTGVHDCSPVTFYHQFHEVEMKPIDAYDSIPPSHGSPAQKGDNDAAATPAATLPSFLRDELPPLQQPFRTSSGNLLTKGPIGTDPHHRSERNEFGDLICTASFSCDSAYLLCLRWMCASGPIVADLISLWQRRASACNMFLFPIPSDPFALPHSLDCDPLRGPVHLPLVMSCNPPCPAAAAGLTSAPVPAGDRDDTATPSGRSKPKPRPLLGLCPMHDIFAKFPSSTRPQRTRLLQEAILAKFGFIRFQNDLSSLIAPTSSSIGSSDSNQFVHVSGNAFVMVLTPGIADATSSSSSGAHSSDCHPTAPGSGATESAAHEGPSATAAPKPAPAMPKFLDPQPATLRPSSLFIEALGVESGSNVGSVVASPHEEYFHRLMSEHHKTVAVGATTDSALCLLTSDKHRTAIPQSPGFLWSFNYMMSRRWKTVASGEEAFGELLLHDFRNFCANKNDRLRHYVESFMAPAAAAADDSASSVTSDEVFSAAEIKCVD